MNVPRYHLIDSQSAQGSGMARYYVVDDTHHIRLRRLFVYTSGKNTDPGDDAASATAVTQPADAVKVRSPLQLRKPVAVFVAMVLLAVVVMVIRTYFRKATSRMYPGTREYAEWKKTL